MGYSGGSLRRQAILNLLNRFPRAIPFITGATIALLSAQWIGILQPAETVAVPVVRLRSAPKPKTPQVRAIPHQAPAVDKASAEPQRPQNTQSALPRKAASKRAARSMPPPRPAPPKDPVVAHLHARFAALSQTAAPSSKIVDLADAVYKHAEKHPSSKLKTPVLRCADLIRTHSNPELMKLKGCLNALQQLYRSPKRLPREEEF